jgi:hypothetical protein
MAIAFSDQDLMSYQANVILYPAILLNLELAIYVDNGGSKEWGKLIMR